MMTTPELLSVIFVAIVALVLVIATVGYFIVQELRGISALARGVKETLAHMGVDLNGIRVAHVTMQSMLETERRRESAAKQPHKLSIANIVLKAIGRR